MIKEKDSAFKDRTEESSCKYQAFISYRHLEEDMYAALRLHRHLEYMHLPPAARHGGSKRIFRDQEELPTSKDLGEDIEKALKDSAFLIAICTPDYIKSAWCQREIESFIESGRKDRILPVILSGSSKTSVPELIRDIPPVYDLSVRTGKRELRRGFELCAYALMAKMTGADEGTIETAARRFKSIVASAVLFALTSVVTGFGIYAIDTSKKIEQNNIMIKEATDEAAEAKRAALEERNRALLKRSEYLAGEAGKAIADNDTELALLLSLEALPDEERPDMPVSDAAIATLRSAMALPGRQKVEYEYAYTVGTDFEIAEARTLSGDTVMIDDGVIEASEYCLTVSSGAMILTEGSRYRKKAIEGGYKDVLINQLSSPYFAVYYGGDRQAVGEKLSEVRYTVKGEPFYCDHAVNHYYMMFAWLSEPAPGQKAMCAMFDMRNGEALWVPEVSGAVSGISFSPTGKRIAVVDSSGKLSVYDTSSGKKTGELDGGFSKVLYPNTSSAFFAMTEDGRVMLLDALKLTVRYELESPSEILSIDYSPGKSYILAACTDAVRIYNYDGGGLVYEIPLGKVPVSAGFVSSGTGITIENSNAILVLYERSIEVYVLSTESDMEDTDGIPLYLEGLGGNFREAFYSNDGKYLYLWQYNNIISKWEALTGRNVWVFSQSFGDGFSSVSYLGFSKDAESIWLGITANHVLAKIDTQTGRLLYTVDDASTLPIESPDGEYAVANVAYTSDYVCFDIKEGRPLWTAALGRRGGTAAGPLYSGDGKRLTVVTERSEAGATGYYAETYDSLTGEKIEETLLLKADHDEYVYCTAAPKDHSFYILKKQDAEVVAVYEEIKTVMIPIKKYHGFSVWIYDAEAGELKALELPQEAMEDPDVSTVSGKCVLSWTVSGDHGEKTGYCCRIDKDVCGQVYGSDTYEGRSLTTEIYDRGFFGEEEVYLTPSRDNNVFLSEDTREVHSMKDDRVVYFANKSHVALSPTGEGLCLYSYDPPYLLLYSNEEEIMRKANIRARGRELTAEQKREYNIIEGDGP